MPVGSVPVGPNPGALSEPLTPFEILPGYVKTTGAALVVRGSASGVWRMIWTVFASVAKARLQERECPEGAMEVPSVLAQCAAVE